MTGVRIGGSALLPSFVVPFLVYSFEEGSGDFSKIDAWGVPVGGGVPVQLTNYVDMSENKALMPDPNPLNGTIVYVQIEGGTGDSTMWTVGPSGAGNTQILDYSSSMVYPQWSRQGDKILFRNGATDLVTCDPDGTNDAVVYSGTNLVSSFSWSRDGSEIVFIESTSPTATLKKMNADGTGLATLVTKANLFQVQWGYDSDFIVYLATGSAGEAYVAATDGTGETALTSFGTNSKQAARRFLADDDSAVYPAYQTSGPGAWQLYQAPTDAGGMVATGIWTTGNGNVAPGRPHCYSIAPGRYYVCAYTGDFSSHGDLDFVSYALDGTDRRIEVSAYSETDGGDPFLVSLGDETT